MENIRKIGRFRHKLTLQEIIIHKGQREAKDYVFCLRYGGRVIINDYEFYHDWIKVAA